MKIKLLYIMLLTIGFFACKEDNEDSPGVKPDMVTILSVDNLNGGATINYRAPLNEDLLYVQARYTINGNEMVTKASYYESSLTVDGFSDTLEYQVTLEAVTRSGAIADPTYATIHPKVCPVDLMLQSLQVSEDWGGINMSWENIREITGVLTILGKDSVGEIVVLDKIYSSTVQEDINIYGYDAEETFFAFVFSDRWDNKSDTIMGMYTPWFEQELDKNKMSGVDLNDTPIYSSAGVSKLLDGNMTTYYHSTTSGGSLPVTFTIDLGVTAQLSRYTQWQRQKSGTPVDHFFYFHYSYRTWEVWGSTEPDPAGSMDGWFKIGEYECVKPSGQAAGSNSDDDVTAGLAGEQCSVPSGIPPVRYVKILMTENWSGSAVGHLGEVAFWGSVLEE